MTTLISRYFGRFLETGSIENLEFVAVSDGKNTRLLYPNRLVEEDVLDFRQASGARIATADSDKPEDILTRLAYRMGMDFAIDEEEFEDMDKALEKAKEYIFEENLFEEPEYEVLEPIIPEKLGKTDE